MTTTTQNTITIRHRITDAVLWTGEADSLKAGVEKAVASGADLRGAYLRGADFRGANLGGAYLRGAYLRGADFRGANLGGADISGAYLRGADFRGANLDDANLTYVRDDIWAVLSASPKEVPGLRAAIAEGRIDGSVYSGECACLVGTLAKMAGCNVDSLPNLKPDSSRPAEMWFLGIRKGDTPETNQMAKLALEWVDTWLDEHDISIPEGEAYEELVQSFADALERQRAEGNSEGRSESERERRHSPWEEYPRPRPWVCTQRAPRIIARLARDQ